LSSIFMDWRIRRQISARWNIFPIKLNATSQSHIFWGVLLLKAWMTSFRISLHSVKISIFLFVFLWNRIGIFFPPFPFCLFFCFLNQIWVGFWIQFEGLKWWNISRCKEYRLVEIVLHGVAAIVLALNRVSSKERAQHFFLASLIGRPPWAGQLSPGLVHTNQTHTVDIPTYKNTYTHARQTHKNSFLSATEEEIHRFFFLCVCVCVCLFHFHSLLKV
jgi:hypothetical protein